MDPIVDYQPAAASNEWPVLYVMLLPMAALSAVVLGCLLFIFVPMMREVLSDLKTDLPTLTDWIIQASRQRVLCGIGLFLLTLLLPLISLPLMVWARQRYPRRVAVARGVTVQIFLLVLMMLGVVLPLVLPFLTIVQAVSGPK